MEDNMLERNKLFNNSLWKETFITQKLDFMIDENRGKTYIRFDTEGSEYETPQNLKQSIEKVGQKIVAYNSGVEDPVLDEVNNQIIDFISALIKRVKDNPNNKLFDSRLTETLRNYRKLNTEYIIATGQNAGVMTTYEVVTNN